MFAAAPAAAEHPKTDIVTTNDGSTLYGEILQLQYATLHLKTDIAGTLEIEWHKVTSVTSQYEYHVELTGGDRHYGTIEPADEPLRMKIIADSDTEEVALADIILLAPIEHGVLHRIDGSINAGLTYTQSNKALQYNIDLDANYRDRKNYVTLSASTIFSDQEDAESSEQRQMALVASRVSQGKFGPFAAAGRSSNPSQGYDSRTVLGGGVTRLFIESSRRLLAFNLGIVSNRENVVDSTDQDSSTELLTALSYRRYKTSSHSPSIVTSLSVFTELSGDTRRNRANFSFTLGWKLIRDFTVNFQITNSYDSQPPGDGANKNNWVVVTGIGYTF